MWPCGRRKDEAIFVYGKDVVPGCSRSALIKMTRFADSRSQRADLEGHTGKHIRTDYLYRNRRSEFRAGDGLRAL